MISFEIKKRSSYMERVRTIRLEMTTSFNQSVTKYLLSTYPGPGPSLELRAKDIMKTETVPALEDFIPT